MKKNFSIKKVNIDVYDDTKVEVFSSPLNPSIDARIALEMNAQEDIARRFAKSSSTSIQEMKTFLSPTGDNLLYSYLLDLSQPYDPEKVLERAIRIKKFKPMIGWVCFYRVKPNRFERYLNEGLKFCINKKYPILEISYAKHSSAPSGVLIHGVRAEIKHIDGLSQNNRPTIVAAIEEDNLSSIRFAEKIGFEYLGSTVYETEAEYEEEYPYIKISVFMYILNWEKFYFKK